MGFSIGGLIFKNAERLTDEDVLAIFGREAFGYTDDISFEKATSSSFLDTAIGKVDNNLFVLGMDIPHACSFEGAELSKVDEKLESISKDGDIVCFLSHSVSGVNAWSIFMKGKRQHTISAVAGQSIADIGNETMYDRGLRANGDDVMKLVENFSGRSIIELISNRNFLLKAYYK